jgi:hypothetical protein
MRIIHVAAVASNLVIAFFGLSVGCDEGTSRRENNPTSSTHLQKQSSVSASKAATPTSNPRQAPEAAEPHLKVGAKVRVYSADNAALDNGGNAFSPDDPRHMTVGLWKDYKKTEGVRLKDQGHGIPGEVIAVEEFLGQTWYRVHTVEGEGWIADFLVLPEEKAR